MDTWILQSNNTDCAAVSGDSNNSNNTSKNNNCDNNLDKAALGRLDALVEEMAYTSQVFERYRSLVASSTSCVDSNDNNGAGPTPTTCCATVVARELLPEWTWKYGALERFLAMQQWQAALQQAVPVTIVLGTGICVPSVVEDAQYLSTRALERAATTGSRQAVATVAYSVCHDVWSTETTTASSEKQEQQQQQLSTTKASAVYQALLDEMGCWSEPEVDQAAKEKKKKIRPCHRRKAAA